jgi:hypothetical protein
LSQPEPSPSPAPEPTAIFRREGDLLVPSLFAQGPWNPEHLHGGPICGVLARAIEACESPVPMRVARISVEMTRAVPMAPFAVRAVVSRAGKRIQQIDAEIEADGMTLVRASALRVRIGRRDDARRGRAGRAGAGARTRSAARRRADALRSRRASSARSTSCAPDSPRGTRAA